MMIVVVVVVMVDGLKLGNTPPTDYSILLALRSF